MFYGTETFNGNISTCDVFIVTTMLEMLLQQRPSTRIRPLPNLPFLQWSRPVSHKGDLSSSLLLSSKSIYPTILLDSVTKLLLGRKCSCSFGINGIGAGLTPVAAHFFLQYQCLDIQMRQDWKQELFWELPPINDGVQAYSFGFSFHGCGVYPPAGCCWRD